MIERRKLGNTGLEVASIGLGTWAMGGDEWGPSDDRESVDVIRRAVELGVDLIDTADVYGTGHSEELVREAIGDATAVYIVSKVGWDIYSDPSVAGGAGQNFSPSYLEHALSESLRRLGRRHIDVYLLHDPPLAVIEAGEALQALKQFKAAGLIGAAGISVGNEEEALAAINVGAEVVELPFNAVRSWAAGNTFAAAEESGVGIIAREPLQRGLLSGKYTRRSTFVAGDHRKSKGEAWVVEAQPAIDRLIGLATDLSVTPAQVALAFTLAHQAVSVVIPGARDRKQLEQNLGAASVRLGPDQVQMLKK
jgi:aryl-alcohol dehydrogenase-like predicted oxidoreductase